MPIYEYKCKNCGHRFEKLVFGEEKIACPKCNSESVDKLPPSSVSIGKSGNDNSGGCPTGTCPFSR